MNITFTPPEAIGIPYIFKKWKAKAPVVEMFPVPSSL